MRVCFGTDGIRGRVGQYPICPSFFLRLGRAFGTLLHKQGSKKVIIGRDTRATGKILESALVAGLAEAGIEAYLAGVLPTPFIAFLTVKEAFDAGIVITASHNPAVDNGIKFFGPDGMKLPDSMEEKIEKIIDEEFAYDLPALDWGNIRPYLFEIHFYQRQFHALFEGLVPATLKIVLDCANGATYQVGPEILRGFGFNVNAIACLPDGQNINFNCGSTSPSVLQKTVLDEQADLGIAFDGDGDRIMMVDEKGEVLDGDELLFIMMEAALRFHLPLRGIVGTQMSNLGLEQAVLERGLPFKRVKVGDRYVIEALKALDWDLGGESSGHIIHMGYGTTGDGIMVALIILAMCLRSKASLFQLKQGMRKYPQCLLNVPLKPGIQPLSHPDVIQIMDSVEKELGESGRLLLRPSGTEPLIRVMVEGENPRQVEELAQRLAQAVLQVTGE